MKKFFSYIFSFLLMGLFILIIVSTILQQTILKKEYLLKTLEQKDCYAKVYQEIEEGFDNYILQSGLEEKVIQGIITKEKVETEMKQILESNMQNIPYTISTEEIENKLHTNIEEYLKSNLIKISAIQQKSIDDFVRVIVTEYKDKLSYLQYSKILYSMQNIVNKVQPMIYIGLAIIIIILFIINWKNKKEFLKYIGIALLAAGLFILVCTMYFYFSTEIEHLNIISQTISILLISIIHHVINLGNIIAGSSVVIGIILILISALGRKV